MSFVLSAVRPPEGEAQYGKALVPEQDPFTVVGSAIRMVVWVFAQQSAPVTVGEAREIGRNLMDAPGREIRHSGTGFTFRLHKVGKYGEVPHPCPCDDDGNTCGRLVLPTDHALAADEDAYCLGCYPWDRNIPACLPKSTGHATNPLD
jgi:hypothetical protein